MLGLARSDPAAKSLAAGGADAHHDFSDYAAAGETDSLAIKVLGAALAKSGRPLVVTSGITLLTPGWHGAQDDLR